MLSLVTKPFKFSYLYSKCKALKSQTNDKEFFETLIDSKNSGDIYAYLQDKRYGHFIAEPTFDSIQDGLKKYFLALYKTITKQLSKKEAVVFELFFFGKERLLENKQNISNDVSIKEFNKLDMEFTKSLQKSLNQLNKENKKDLSKIFGSYFDNINILTIFRLRVFYNAQAHEILPFLFPYGLRFKQNNINTFLTLSSLSEFNIELEPFYKVEFDDLSSFKKMLYQDHYNILNSVWKGSPFKISIIFSLLRMKEIELKNIKSIIQGVKYSQSKEDMKRMLLGVNI